MAAPAGPDSLARSQVPRPAGVNIEVAVRRSYAAASALIIVAWATILANTTLGWNTQTLLVAAFLVTGLVLTVTVWQDRVIPLLILAAVGLAGILYVWGRLSGPDVPEDSAALLLSYAALTIVVLIRRRTWLWLLVVAVPVLWVELQQTLGPATVSALGPATATAAACLLALPVIEQMADRITLSARRRDLSVQVRVEQEALLLAHRQTQGILHDQALAALRSISTPSVDRDDAREAATLAWYGLSTADHESAQAHDVDLVASVRALHVPGLQIALATDHPTHLIPAAVANALTDAAGEALRNVARHAGVSRARVSVKRRDAGVEVEVLDVGRGFEPRRTGQSFGLHESIQRRVALLGGEVRVRSAPGRGTRITLVWQPQESHEGAVPSDLTPTPATRMGAQAIAVIRSPHRPRELTDAVGNPRRAVASAVVPFAVLALLWAVTGWSAGQPRWLFAWAFALIGYGGWLLIRGEEAYQLRWHLALQTLAVGGVLGFLAQAPPDSLTSGLAWPVSLAALAAAITAAYRGGWLAVVVSALFVLAVALFAVMSAQPPSLAAIGPALPAIVSCCWPVAIGVTMRTILLALGHRDAEQTRAAHAAMTLALTAQSHRQALDRRLAHLQNLLDSSLGALSRGEIDPGDPQVIAAASQAEQVARDELQVPWLLTPELAEAVRQVRARGTEVIFSTTSDLVTAPAAARDMLSAALSIPARLTSLQLTIASDDSPVMLAVDVKDEAAREQIIEAMTAVAPQARAIGTVVLAHSEAS